MSSEDAVRLSSQFIRTWHGIQFEDTSTALKLFCVLIHRNIIGPHTHKMSYLLEAMGFVSGVSKLRKYITAYDEATWTNEPRQEYPSISIENKPVLREVENILRQNAVAERYDMKSIPFCEQCSYLHVTADKNRCQKCLTTKCQYRGIAQVFNNCVSKDNDDEYFLKKLLNKIGYYVYVSQNCPSTEFEIILKRRREEYSEHTEFDSFICCVISKSRNGTILDSNGKACNMSDFTSQFSDTLCPNLKGKPRIFLVQMYDDEYRHDAPLQLPCPQLDCLYVYHILPTEYQVKGSLFIRVLKDVVGKCGLFSDLRIMLTKINQHITESKSNEKVFVPVIISRLKKRIYFAARVL